MCSYLRLAMCRTVLGWQQWPFICVCASVFVCVHISSYSKSAPSHYLNQCWSDSLTVCVCVVCVCVHIFSYSKSAPSHYLNQCWSDSLTAGLGGDVLSTHTMKWCGMGFCATYHRWPVLGNKNDDNRNNQETSEARFTDLWRILPRMVSYESKIIRYV